MLIYVDEINLKKFMFDDIVAGFHHKHVGLLICGTLVCVFLHLCASDRVCVRKAACVCESDSAAPSQRTHLVPTL